MSTKTASMIASVVTALLVLVVVVVFGFGGIVMLNGFMNADVAVYTGFTCLGITLILCPILAWMLTKTLASRFNWNTFPAVAIAVLASTFLSGGMGFVSLIVMGIVAEVMWRS